MIVIPLNFVNTRHSVLMIVITPDALDRMKQADPITLGSPTETGPYMSMIKFPQRMGIVVAYEEDEAKIIELAKRDAGMELFDYLQRGYKFIQGRDGLQDATETNRIDLSKATHIRPEAFKG